MTHKAGRDTLREENYVAFVSSLFDGVRMLVIGAFMQVASVLCAWWDTGHSGYLWLSGAMFLAVLWRISLTYAFLAERDHLKSAIRARYWEKRYTYSAGAAAFLLGMFAFLGISIAPGPFATLGSCFASFGAVPTIVGRLYGSPRLVKILLACILVPIASGLFLDGDVTHYLLAGLIIPYAGLVVKMSGEVRQMMNATVDRQQEIIRIAHRFDLALNNMTQGLFMFDEKRRISVANDRARELLNIQDSLELEGRNIIAVLRYGVLKGTYSKTAVQKLKSGLDAMRNGHAPRKTTIELAEERVFEFSIASDGEHSTVLTFEDVTERRNAERQITQMARFDSLTGLPNRSWFRDVVRERLRDLDVGRTCLLIVFDVDDFKHVNDTLGHPAGDFLLSEIGRRLRVFTESGMTVSRHGGDEFLVFAEADLENIPAFVAELRAQIHGLYHISGQVMYVSVSVGYVVCEVGDFDLQDLLVKADLALYESKDAGKGVCTAYEESLDERYRKEQRLKLDLARAVEEGQLEVLYQPIIDVRDQRIVATEALSRWTHPVLGAVSPSLYIPLAERIGIITRITEAVLERACADCAAWPEHMTVSVNMSAIDFRNNGLVELVADCLQRHGLAPHRLEIELTETSVLSNEAATVRLLQKLKALGVRIALDDFGTGYSSLSHLHRLPLDRVKIDRSFLNDIDTQSSSLELVRGVARLSKELGLSVTLEGVETHQHFDMARESGSVDRVQGFLFGSALPASGVASLACMPRFAIARSTASEKRRKATVAING